MKKIKLAAVFALVAGLFFLGAVMIGASDAQVLAKCPVMGMKIDEKVYTDHEGKRIFFCCKHCIGKFEAEPGAYLKKLESEGVTPADIPK